MSFYLNFLLTSLICVGMLYLIPDGPLAQSLETISVDAMKDTQNIHLPLMPSDSSQVASFYLFPFMRDLVPETADNAVYDRISLAANNTSNTSNTSNTWRIISGMWQPSEDGVQAGDTSYSVLSTAVKPVMLAPTDLDINTSFTINSLAPNTASYISIVYSWVDQQNFKLAGIMFWNSQSVPGLNGAYADFGTVSNGTLSWDPTWPGSKIDLNSNPRGPISMTLFLRDNAQELFVNGDEVLQKDSVETDSGYVGLSYGRVQDLIFHQFDVQKQNNLP